MIESTVDEIDSAFGAAKNANSAIKSFLKKEARAGDAVVRFAKNFRVAVATGKPAIIRAFIDRNFPQNEAYFLMCARYAHNDIITSIVEKIFESHAEEFNSTYEKLEEGIRVKDRKKFSAVISAVNKMIEDGLKSASLPVTNFLKKAVLVSVFDDNVIGEVMSCLPN
jgi:hypothetical protein